MTTEIPLGGSDEPWGASRYCTAELHLQAEAHHPPLLHESEEAAAEQEKAAAATGVPAAAAPPPATATKRPKRTKVV